MKFTGNLPPPHLLDLGAIENLQHYGRERRHEYWTIPALKGLFATEGFEADSAEKFAKIMNADMSLAGGFATFDDEDFYDGTDATFANITDNFNRLSRAGNFGKKNVRKNPIRADGTIAIGRPRKEWALKRKAEEAGVDISELEPVAPTKKRSRAKKGVMAENGDDAPQAPPKKRSRAIKKADPSAVSPQPIIPAEQLSVADPSTSTPKAKAKPTPKTKTSKKASVAQPSVSEIADLAKNQSSTHSVPPNTSSNANDENDDTVLPSIIPTDTANTILSISTPGSANEQAPNVSASAVSL